MIWLSVDVLFLLSYLSNDEVGPLGDLEDLGLALGQQEGEVEDLTSNLWSGYPLDKVTTLYYTTIISQGPLNPPTRQ